MATSRTKQPKHNWWQRRTGAEQATLVGALIAAFGGIVVAVIGLYGGLTVNVYPPRSTPAATSHGTSSPSPGRLSSASSGTIALPAPGANVRAYKNLHASGVADIPPGHKLELFLEFGSQAKYWGAGDPRTTVPLVNGKWHGAIYIGAPGGITIWLVDLSPASVVLVNKEVNYQNNGFPSIKTLGKILTSAQYTAK